MFLRTIVNSLPFSQRKPHLGLNTLKNQQFSPYLVCKFLSDSREVNRLHEVKTPWRRSRRRSPPRRKKKRRKSGKHAEPGLKGREPGAVITFNLHFFSNPYSLLQESEISSWLGRVLLCSLKGLFSAIFHRKRLSFSLWRISY